MAFAESLGFYWACAWQILVMERDQYTGGHKQRRSHLDASRASGDDCHLCGGDLR